MLDRTIQFILGHDHFKTLGASRTDAMVSAMKSACKISLNEEVDCSEFFEKLNQNLPADIKALELTPSEESFQVIGHAKTKTYYYLFSNEDRAWPFAAPYMCNIPEPLDIDLMREGAKLFKGSHCFAGYCYKPSPQKVFQRNVLFSEIAENKLLTANFFPPSSFLYTVKGQGFMRHQIRLMMGALFRLGRKEIGLEDIKASLKPEARESIGFVAPASGLILGELSFQKQLNE